jgi:predicted alpha/beta superfamily hydrolase
MMGGGRQFARFLEDELKPWVSHRYAVRGDDWAIIGSSLGGLFLTHVLVETPGIFHRYGIGSPSYWWDDKAIFELVASSAAPENVTARVAMTVGEYEQPSGRRRYLESLPDARRSEAIAENDGFPPPDMVSDARHMYGLLHSRSSLRVAFEVIPGEYHQTVVPAHLSRSVRLLYDGLV